MFRQQNGTHDEFVKKNSKYCIRLISTMTSVISGFLRYMFCCGSDTYRRFLALMLEIFVNCDDGAVCVRKHFC